MNSKRSVLLTVGAVLAASLMAHAASPIAKPASQISKPTPTSKPATSSPITLSSSSNPAAISPQSVDPKPNSPGTVLTPSSLATVDTVLSYCSNVDRSSASGYQSAITIITQGHSDAEVAGVRGTAEYAQTQGALNSQLARTSLGLGIPACRAFIASSRHVGGVPITSPIHKKIVGSN